METRLESLELELKRVRAKQTAAATKAKEEVPVDPIRTLPQKAEIPPLYIVEKQPYFIKENSPNSDLPTQPSRAETFAAARAMSDVMSSIEESTQKRPTSIPSTPPQEPLEINWEKFLGVKMFAWVGGLALFLGMAFFIKYSFENNLISPALRIAFGYAVGLGLMVASLWLSREKFAVMIQTFCSTAILIFYASTFASHS